MDCNPLWAPDRGSRQYEALSGRNGRINSDMTCAASDNRAGTEELRLRMPHDNYSTAEDKVFHDGTLFPQSRNHICSAKALWPRAAGKLPARASACG